MGRIGTKFTESQILLGGFPKLPLDDGRAGVGLQTAPVPAGAQVAVIVDAGVS